MQKAVIYARFSTLEQGKGSSLDRQLGNGKRFVTQREWSLEREITDLGRSAYHGTNRTEGSALHEFEADAREGRHTGKVLCVENLDRLSRQGIKAAAKLVWALNASGVDVATWHDGHVYKAESDSELLDILYIATKSQRAFEESDTKSKRGFDTWEERYKNIAINKPGTRSGRPPAWLVWDGLHYQPDPQRAALVNEIFDLYLRGTGTYLIVQLLNQRGEPTWPVREKEGKGGWYMPYVHGLLKNRAVLGEYVTLKGEVISTDYYPRVVSIEKFTAANALLGGRAKTGGRDFQRFNNLLSGLPKCAVCDGTAAYENKGENSFTKHTTKSGEQRLYARKVCERLRCDANRRRHGCDNASMLDYQIVERAVLDQLLSLTTDDQSRSTATRALDEAISQAVRDIEVASQRLSNVIDALVDAPSKALTARVGDLEREIESLEDKRKTLMSHREAEASKPSVLDDAELIAEIRQDLNSADRDTRIAARERTNAALRRLVDAIYIGDDGTFTVLSEVAVWQFDRQGRYLTGQAL